jgi:hypothetical protein
MYENRKNGTNSSPQNNLQIVVDFTNFIKLLTSNTYKIIMKKYF